jgi:hypothetical protein
MTANFSKTELENMFMYFGLNWEILSIRKTSPDIAIMDEDDGYEQEFLADKSKFLPFFEGSTLDTPIYLSCYSGTEPLQI